MSGAPRPKTWTCPKRSCRHVNRVPKRTCAECGTPRKIRRARHLIVLREMDYAEFVAMNGGDFCAVCLRQRGEKDRRFDRDHDHRSGRARGLLCHKCNRALPSWVTPEWLRAAAEYLERGTSLKAAA